MAARAFRAGDAAHQPTSHIQLPGPTCLGANSI
jgi:hypothetical protein